MAYSVGIDLTAVAEVEDAVSRFGARYLRRVYSSGELARCGTNPLRLAESFAAKEAAMKALAAASQLPWPSIELVRDGTSFSLRMTGPAGRRAREAGVSHLAVSVSHASGHAAAVVIARTA